MSQQIEKAMTIIDAATLSSSYGSATGSIDLGTKCDQVVFYLKWSGGTAGARLYAQVFTSPTNEIYYPLVHELIEPTGLSDFQEKQFYWVYDSTINVIDEEIGEMRSDVNNAGGRLSFDTIPSTGTTPIIRHSGTAFGTVTEKANDAAFTAPASLSAGTVEWSLSTGNLNFASADVTSYNTQTIKADSVNTTNLIRFPIPVKDRFVKIALRELNGSGGTISVYMCGDRKST